MDNVEERQRSNTLRREERKESGAPGWLALEYNGDSSPLTEEKSCAKSLQVVGSGTKSGLSQSPFYESAQSQLLLRKKGFRFLLLFLLLFLYCGPYGPLRPDPMVPANTIYLFSKLFGHAFCKVWCSRAHGMASG